MNFILLIITMICAHTSESGSVNAMYFTIVSAYVAICILRGEDACHLFKQDEKHDA